MMMMAKAGKIPVNAKVTKVTRKVFNFKIDSWKPASYVVCILVVLALYFWKY
jgi:hypothetical protein